MLQDSLDRVTVLITAIGASGGGAIVKSLQAKGISRLIVCDADKYAPGLYLRDVTSYVVPYATDPTYLNAILKIVDKEKVRVIIPCPDEEVLALSKVKERITREGASLVIPDYETVEKAINKYKTMQLADKFNIPHPKTYLVEGRLRLGDIPLDFPIVIKPVIGRGARGIKYAANEKELEEGYAKTRSEFGATILQEYIPGGTGGVFTVATLFDTNHKLKASIVLRKIRERPATGGVAYVAETVRNEQVRSYGLKLMEKIGKWVGPASLEFKLDTRDGIPKLMEINPRLFGYVYLATEAGINLPYLITQIATNKEFAEIHDYELNKIFFRMSEDVVLDKESLAAQGIPLSLPSTESAFK